MKVIGLTGGTGGGKTTVLELIRAHGGETLDCDRIYYEMLAADENLRHALTENFGDVFHGDGTLDREKLRALVFSDEAALRRLNSVVYYYMGLEIRRRLVEMKRRGVPLAAIDAVNLIESGLGELCHVTVAVLAPERDRLARIMARDHISEAAAAARIAAQHGDDYYIRHCRVVLQNDGTQDQLKQKATEVLRDYL